MAWSMVTQFAPPSPTGFLHLGHAIGALCAWRRARGGRFLLRLEDIAATGCRPDCAAAILEDLARLGLDRGGRGARGWVEPGEGAGHGRVPRLIRDGPGGAPAAPAVR
jgi:glutamyl/glutaminyl-tRNA synthetase